jgi:hypothetical protein
LHALGRDARDGIRRAGERARIGQPRLRSHHCTRHIILAVRGDPEHHRSHNGEDDDADTPPHPPAGVVGLVGMDGRPT